jgi:hypothetical protein
MSTTRQIPHAEWKNYFERFTQQHLDEDPPDTVTVEVISPRVGDQYEVTTVPLLGLSYDPKGETFEVLTEDIEHLAFAPIDIWVIEDDEGFPTTISLTRPDGTKELLHLRRKQPAAARYEQPPA